MPLGGSLLILVCSFDKTCILYLGNVGKRENLFPIPHFPKLALIMFQSSIIINRNLVGKSQVSSPFKE